MKLKIVVLIIVILLIPGTLLIPTIVTAAVDTAQVVIAKETRFVGQVTATGTIESLEEAQLYLDTTVVPDQVYVEVGDYVTEGQVIADVDVNKTKAVIAQNPFNSFGETEIEIPDELSETLSVFGALSGLSEEELIQAFSAAQGGSKNAQITQTLEIPTQLTAPMSGVIGDLTLQTGMPTQAGTAAVTIVDNSKLALRAEVGESQIQEVSHGDRCYITGSGFSGKHYTGTVTRIFPTAKKSSTNLNTESTVEILIEIDQPDQYLMAGFTAKAQIVTEIRENVLTVPYEAIGQDEDGKEYIFLYENGKAVQRYIETGEEMQSGVEVTAGLGLGDVVIQNNSSIRKNGQYVRIV